MSLLISKTGLLSTVQDLGRLGWRRFGVNPNGAMDTTAARIANILVGNSDDAAFIEMHFPAAEIVFEQAAILSVCGGDFGAELDDQPVSPWRAVNASSGAILRFKNKRCGERCYLAVSGGIDVPTWLGSASTNSTANVGGLEGRALRAGDRLGIVREHTSHTAPLPAAAASLLPRYGRFPTVRIIPGAEFEYLDDGSRKALVQQDFAISKSSNRMGFRLSGKQLSLTAPLELVSSAVCFGTIQLLPDGQLIILMADQQTAGGYPRIAHVIGYDLPLVGQLGAGDKIAFHLVDVAQAEELTTQFEKELSFLRIACRFAYE